MKKYSYIYTSKKLVAVSIIVASALITLLITAIGLPNLPLAKKPSAPASAAAADYTQFVNMVQGPGSPNNSDKQIIMRYPLGRIGLWSRDTGEIADSVTRGVRLYPMIDQTVSKDSTDWRSSINANPSQTDITYSSNSPAKGSTVSLTVTPHVSIYKYHFTNASSYAAIGITLGATHNQYGPNWTANTVTVVDNQTIQVTLTSSNRTIYYYIKFNTPGTGGSANNLGYMKFPSSTTDVIAAVALSHASMTQAQTFFTNEFSDFNFSAAAQRLKDAWNAKLGKIDVQNADQLTKQMLYTGLYSVYVNIIDATDGSPYASYASAYGSPVLTIGSSIGWEYVGGGYFRSAFDQGRIIYYLLTLLDPQVMTDILHTYQAQYDRDKVILGNWDPYTPTSWTDQQWGFWGGMFLRAYLQGVPGVDYTKAKNAIADTFGNPNNIMAKSQYLSKGYIPADGGVANFMSRGLEWSTDLQGLALLANALGDSATYNQFIPYGQAYKKTWDSTNMVFRAKNADGSWAAPNTGFFEGTDKGYGFDEPQDPLGLTDLYGDANMTANINSQLTPNRDYNDYQPGYRILPIYSNSPSTAEDIARNRWIPQFKSLNMWEGWWSNSDVYYTDNAGGLVLAILGLYPMQTPGAQWVITSPAITTAVIHGAKDITIQANNNSATNAYVSSISVNGSTFPSYFISGKTLVANNTTITLNMTNTPSRIGNMYITGTDGEIESATTDNTNYVQFQNDPIGVSSRAKIYATKQPTAITVNGSPLTTWTYTSNESIIDIKSIPAGMVSVYFTANITPSPITPVPTGSISPTSVLPSTQATDTPTSFPSGTSTGTQQPTQQISDTSQPTANPTSGATRGTLSVHFEGIDPQNNTKPHHPQRSLNVSFYKTANFSLPPDASLPITVTFSSSDPTGAFTNNSIDLTSIPPGSYYILVQSPEGSLREQLTATLVAIVQGQITALNGTQTTPHPTTLMMGDLNGDNQIDLTDYSILVDCFGSKAVSPACKKHAISDSYVSNFADLNDDGSINGIDYNILIRNFGQIGY